MIGGGPGDGLSPLALYLPTRYRRATALHAALTIAPPGTMGELWGPSALIMRATRRGDYLVPVDWVDLSASGDGGPEWDAGALDFRWVPVDTAPPASFAAGLGLVCPLDVLGSPGGAYWCPGLARYLMTGLNLEAITQPITWTGTPAASAASMYAGFWREAAGVGAGALVGEARTVFVAGSVWERALATGDPDAPTRLSGAGALAAPTAEAVHIAALCWGVSAPGSRALFSGGWRPTTDAGGTGPGANTTQGSAGQAMAPILGCVVGTFPTPPTTIAWARFRASGDLA
jgi:hypothetical protein